MKILFVLLDLAPENKDGGMYGSLAEHFRRQGHEITIIAPDVEHAHTFCNTERDMRVVRVASKETQGVSNMYKKGIALATLPYYFKLGYKKYLATEKFDWIVMPTPPITLSGFVKYVKQRIGAKFYLILRDIHPQSVWSIGLLHNRFEYWLLDRKAKIGYQTADLIGCMSQGNINFIYSFVALFGGNLGRGQRIENIVCLAEHYLNTLDIVFLIIAKGVEKDRLKKIAVEKNLSNIRFMDFMPQKDYLNLIRSVDLGLVSINEKYSVPTCPSKAVSYMAAGVPVLAMINSNNDYGQIIENCGAGYWSIGSDKQQTIKLFDKIYINSSLRLNMSEAGRRFYLKNCTVKAAYETMIQQMKNI